MITYLFSVITVRKYAAVMARFGGDWVSLYADICIPNTSLTYLVLYILLKLTCTIV